MILVTLVRPEYGLYLLILAVPFGSVREIAISGLTVGAAEALVGLVLAAWLAKMVATREINIIHPPLLLPLLIFLGAILLSLTGALSLKYSFKEILKWLEVLGVYLFVANVVEKKQAPVVVLLMLLAGIGQALLGFYQFFGRVGPPAFVILGRFVRAYGTFEQPNPYGGYLGLVLPLACGVLLGVGKLGYWRLDIRYLVAILGLATMGTALIMSWSRGAWLGFAAAFTLMILAYSRRAAILFALVCLLIASVLLLGSFQALPQTIVQRLTDFLPYLHTLDVRGVKLTDANYAVVERLAHWQAAWGMFSDRPWLGVGIGNYEPVYSAYSLPGWTEPLGHAHNYYLNIAAEAGLIGLAMLSWSRGAWLGFAAAFTLMILAYSRRAAILFALVCLLIASVLLLGSFQALPQTIVQRLTDFLPYLHTLDVRGVKLTDANYAVVERLAHWQAAWGMFSDRPWLGVGIGNYEPVYSAYSLPGWTEPLGHAHNYYLNIAAEAGLIGLAAYLVLWGAAFWQAWNVVRTTEGYWRGVAVGILGALTHLSVHNLFDNLYVHNMYLHVAMLLGLLFVIVKREGENVLRIA